MSAAQPQLIKNFGLTQSERYLNFLGQRTFLSLWSHAGIYRNQRVRGKGSGKELCDMLVVCDEHVVIFSDKYCRFPQTGSLRVDWNRWFKRAVLSSAQQAWGAERWLRQFPERVFLDRECSLPFPFQIPPPSSARYHIVVVAHGYSEATKGHSQLDTSSIPLDSWVRGATHFVPESHPVRFVVGDIDPEKTFVHVLTEGSLEIVLSTLDTISDFTSYLSKKEMLFRNTHRIIAYGEEDLMAFYLKDVNDEGKHDFVFERNGNGIVFENGHWEEFQRSPQRHRQIEANRISYVWDYLIEQFAHHAIAGTEYFASEPGGVSSTERVLRELAKEGRFGRRMLAKAFLEILEKGAAHDRATRYFADRNNLSRYYIFLSLKQPPSLTEDQYRLARRNLLEACCLVLKHKHPHVLEIIGIATEPISEEAGRSEDAIYMDVRTWTEESGAEAIELANRLGIMRNLSESRFHEDEYPE
jgi:hypothetical protein